LRFESAEQRTAFAAALQRAVMHTIGRHASPARRPDGSPGPGRLYRLVLGCYPIALQPAAADRPVEDHQTMSAQCMSSARGRRRDAK
jgi:hypothetical protein